MSLNSVTGGGTVERVIQLHKALLETGVESEILTIKDFTDEGAAIEGATYLPCINARWFIPFPERTTVRKLVEQADVIHLMNHWTFLNAWVYLLARKYKKPYVVCPAGALTIFGRSKWKKYLYQTFIGERIMRDAFGAIAISKDEIKLMENTGIKANKIVHIANGVNERDFSFNNDALFRQSLGVGSSSYILFVGRLNEIKGPDLLLEAFSKLAGKISCDLVFAGPDGGLGEELQLRVKNLNLTNRVHFTGYLGGDVKSSAYHGAELLVIPSRHEAMSIVALEAAICGTPVLLTDQCGFSRLVDIGGAIEVPATIEGLYSGLVEMLGDEVSLNEMGMKVYKFVIRKYTWVRMAKKFLEMIEKIS